MRKKNRLKDFVIVSCGVISAIGSVVPFDKYFPETLLMGNIAPLDFLVSVFPLGYYGAILYLIVPAVISLIQGMKPVNRFKQLHPEIEREQQNIKNDKENCSLDTERPLDEIYRDREQLNLKLKKLRIYSPDPKDQKIGYLLFKN